MSANFFAERFGKTRPVTVVYLIIAAAALVATVFTSPAIIVGVVLVFGFCTAISWPILEGLIATGTNDAHILSRRISIYNIVWAGVGTLIIAVNGTIIEKIPKGVFLFSAIVCIASALISTFGNIVPPEDIADPSHAPSNPPPEPKLARQRKIALWLSRICVPAMYIVIYALAAMMPSLPVLQNLRPAMQTLLSSIWFFVRWSTFLILGATVFWHTRPRLLLAAAALLLVSFVAIAIRPSDLFHIYDAASLDLASMIIGQIIFGAAIGLIYMASLYFGMVLSDGSTAHGGYHEALIGLGMMLGPAAGVMTQYFWPGDQRTAVEAVGALIGVSILLASVASLRFSRKRG